MAQDHVESAESLKERITMQRVEDLIKKVVQGREKGEDLEGKFHSLAKAVQGARMLVTYLSYDFNMFDPG
jgi:hypothetical protein